MIKHDSFVASLNFPARNDSIIRFATRNDIKSLLRQRNGIFQLDPRLFRNLKGPTIIGVSRNILKCCIRLMMKLNPEWRIDPAGDISKAVDNCFIRSHIRSRGHWGNSFDQVIDVFLARHMTVASLIGCAAACPRDVST